jgi:hypothetical protein
MNSEKKTDPNHQPETKERNMTADTTPEWVKSAPRVDRPEINRWFKPEDGPINGTMIWRGRNEDRRTGDTYPAYAIREADTGLVIGVSERAGLRDLRNVKVGSRVFIRPGRVKELDNGHRFQTYEIFAEDLESPSEPTRGRSGPQGAPAQAEDTPF